jgi:hypothetical protein
MDRRVFLKGAGCALAGLSAASAEPPPASSGDLAGDIRILRRAFETLHPGLYRYQTPADAAAAFDRLEQAFAARPPLAALYLDLSRTLARIRCGHTYANFYNQSEATAAALFSQRTRLPFDFRWIEGRMAVTASHASALAPGAEILKVGGVRTRDILRALLPYVRADGANDAKRRALLEGAGPEKYRAFDIFHALVFGPTEAALSLSVRDPETGRARRIDAAPLVDAAPAPAAGEPSDLGWRFDWPTEQIGRLTMPDWAAYKTKWDWRSFLDGVFAELDDRHAQGLIVDLRHNEGGNDCGDEILARMIDADLSPGEEYERRVRFRTTPKDLDPFLDTWDDSFRSLGADAEPLPGGFFRLPAAADGPRLIRPRTPRFAGKLAVLTGPQNSSATFQFARLVAAKKLGVLIGEPTGGNQRGINGGAFFFVRLPASGLEVDLPLIGTFARTPMPDAGLLPDIPAPLTLAALRAGRDPAMDAALAHLRG